MPGHDDLPLLSDAALIAGRIASAFSGREARRWDKPGGAGPVTEADLAVDRYLRHTLCTARPDYGWLSEETEDNADRLMRERVFIVDPIDGTRSFVEGARTWAHSLAVAEAGEIVAAVVYLPLRGKLYTAAKGRGAALNGAPIQAASETDLTRMEILAARPAMMAKHWAKACEPTFKRAYRPSLAYRMALLGEGRFDGMLTLRKTWEWDIAAGALIIAEAGGAVSDRRGAPLRFNNPDPRLDGVVAGSAAAQSQLVAALA